MTAPPYRVVVFDLDGTLVDSSHDIAAALNRALAGRAERLLTGADVTPLLGEGVAALVRDAVAMATPGAGGSLDLDEVAARYLAEYRARPVVESRLFTGVADTLDALGRAGVPMAVCTNKVTSIARQVLDGLGVGHHFASVVGADRPTRSKPDPEHLRLALAELGAAATEAVLVGDSPLDQQCAEAAGAGFRAVAWSPPEVTGTRLTRFSALTGLVRPRAAEPRPAEPSPADPRLADPRPADLQERR